MRVTFKLEDEDLAHLKRMLRSAAAAAKEKDPQKIVAAALVTARRAREAEPPAYVLEHITMIEGIARMVEDTQWRLPTSVRESVCGVLAYFAEPHDLIPDHIPVLGFLDDAIMIEIMAAGFLPELQGYRNFCRYRESLSPRLSEPLLQQRLVKRRRQLRARIQRQRAQDGVSAGWRFKLW